MDFSSVHVYSQTSFGGNPTTAYADMDAYADACAKVTLKNTAEAVVIAGYLTGHMLKAGAIGLKNAFVKGLKYVGSALYTCAVDYARYSLCKSKHAIKFIWGDEQYEAWVCDLKYKLVVHMDSVSTDEVGADDQSKNKQASKDRYVLVSTDDPNEQEVKRKKEANSNSSKDQDNIDGSQPALTDATDNPDNKKEVRPDPCGLPRKAVSSKQLPERQFPESQFPEPQQDVILSRKHWLSILVTRPSTQKVVDLIAYLKRRDTRLNQGELAHVSTAIDSIDADYLLEHRIKIKAYEAECKGYQAARKPVFEKLGGVKAEKKLKSIHKSVEEDANVVQSKKKLNNLADSIEKRVEKYAHALTGGALNRFTGGGALTFLSEISKKAKEGEKADDAKFTKLGKLLSEIGNPIIAGLVKTYKEQCLVCVEVWKSAKEEVVLRKKDEKTIEKILNGILKRTTKENDAVTGETFNRLQNLLTRFYDPLEEIQHVDPNEKDEEKKAAVLKENEAIKERNKPIQEMNEALSKCKRLCAEYLAQKKEGVKARLEIRKAEAKAKGEADALAEVKIGVKTKRNSEKIEEIKDADIFQAIRAIKLSVNKRVTQLEAGCSKRPEVAEAIEKLSATEKQIKEHAMLNVVVAKTLLKDIKNKVERGAQVGREVEELNALAKGVGFNDFVAEVEKYGTQCADYLSKADAEFKKLNGPDEEQVLFTIRTNLGKIEKGQAIIEKLPIDDQTKKEREAFVLASEKLKSLTTELNDREFHIKSWRALRLVGFFAWAQLAHGEAIRVLTKKYGYEKLNTNYSEAESHQRSFGVSGGFEVTDEVNAKWSVKASGGYTKKLSNDEERYLGKLKLINGGIVAEIAFKIIGIVNAVGKVVASITGGAYTEYADTPGYVIHELPDMAHEHRNDPELIPHLSRRGTLGETLGRVDDFKLDALSSHEVVQIGQLKKEFDLIKGDLNQLLSIAATGVNQENIKPEPPKTGNQGNVPLYVQHPEWGELKNAFEQYNASWTTKEAKDALKKAGLLPQNADDTVANNVAELCMLRYSSWQEEERLFTHKVVAAFADSGIKRSSSSKDVLEALSTAKLLPTYEGVTKDKVTQYINRCKGLHASEENRRFSLIKVIAALKQANIDSDSTLSEVIAALNKAKLLTQSSEIEKVEFASRCKEEYFSKESQILLGKLTRVLRPSVAADDLKTTEELYKAKLLPMWLNNSDDHAVQIQLAQYIACCKQIAKAEQESRKSFKVVEAFDKFLGKNLNGQEAKIAINELNAGVVLDMLRAAKLMPPADENTKDKEITPQQQGAIDLCKDIYIRAKTRQFTLKLVDAFKQAKIDLKPFEKNTATSSYHTTLSNTTSTTTSTTTLGNAGLKNRIAKDAVEVLREAGLLPQWQNQREEEIAKVCHKEYLACLKKRSEGGQATSPDSFGKNVITKSGVDSNQSNSSKTSDEEVEFKAVEKAFGRAKINQESSEEQVLEALRDAGILPRRSLKDFAKFCIKTYVDYLQNNPEETENQATKNKAVDAITLAPIKVAQTSVFNAGVKIITAGFELSAGAGGLIDLLAGEISASLSGAYQYEHVAIMAKRNSGLIARLADRLKSPEEKEQIRRVIKEKCDGFKHIIMNGWREGAKVIEVTDLGAEVLAMASRSDDKKENYVSEEQFKKFLQIKGLDHEKFKALRSTLTQEERLNLLTSSEGKLAKIKYSQQFSELKTITVDTSLHCIKQDSTTLTHLYARAAGGDTQARVLIEKMMKRYAAADVVQLLHNMIFFNAYLFILAKRGENTSVLDPLVSPSPSSAPSVPASPSKNQSASLSQQLSGAETPANGAGAKRDLNPDLLKLAVEQAQSESIKEEDDVLKIGPVGTAATGSTSGMGPEPSASPGHPASPVASSRGSPKGSEPISIRASQLLPGSAYSSPEMSKSPSNDNLLDYEHEAEFAQEQQKAQLVNEADSDLEETPYQNEFRLNEEALSAPKFYVDEDDLKSKGEFEENVHYTVSDHKFTFNLGTGYGGLFNMGASVAKLEIIYRDRIHSNQKRHGKHLFIGWSGAISGTLTAKTIKYIAAQLGTKYPPDVVTKAIAELANLPDFIAPSFSFSREVSMMRQRRYYVTPTKEKLGFKFAKEHTILTATKSVGLDLSFPDVASGGIGISGGYSYSNTTTDTIDEIFSDETKDPWDMHLQHARSVGEVDKADGTIDPKSFWKTKVVIEQAPALKSMFTKIGTEQIADAVDNAALLLEYYELINGQRKPPKIATRPATAREAANREKEAAVLKEIVGLKQTAEQEAFRKQYAVWGEWGAAPSNKYKKMPETPLLEEIALEAKLVANNSKLRAEDKVLYEIAMEKYFLASKIMGLNKQIAELEGALQVDIVRKSLTTAARNALEHKQIEIQGAIQTARSERKAIEGALLSAEQLDFAQKVVRLKVTIGELAEKVHDTHSLNESKRLAKKLAEMERSGYAGVEEKFKKVNFNDPFQYCLAAFENFLFAYSPEFNEEKSNAALFEDVTTYDYDTGLRAVVYKKEKVAIETIDLEEDDLKEDEQIKQAVNVQPKYNQSDDLFDQFNQDHGYMTGNWNEAYL